MGSARIVARNVGVVEVGKSEARGLVRKNAPRGGFAREGSYNERGGGAERREELSEMGESRSGTGEEEGVW